MPTGTELGNNLARLIDIFSPAPVPASASTGVELGAAQPPLVHFILTMAKFSLYISLITLNVNSQRLNMLTRLF